MAESTKHAIENPITLDIIEMATQSHTKQGHFLTGILKKEIPITYRDGHGRLVKEFPDGRIELIQEAS